MFVEIQAVQKAAQTAAPPVQKAAETVAPNIWSTVPSMITAALVLLFLVCFWRELKSLLTSLAWRIKVGAQIKIGTIEIGAFEAKQSAISSDEEIHGVRKR
jgi:hypothetical protein